MPANEAVAESSPAAEDLTASGWFNQPRAARVSCNALNNSGASTPPACSGRHPARGHQSLRRRQTKLLQSRKVHALSPTVAASAARTPCQSRISSCMVTAPFPLPLREIANLSRDLTPASAAGRFRHDGGRRIRLFPHQAEGVVVFHR
jgi:hypothetical protein